MSVLRPGTIFTWRAHHRRADPYRFECRVRTFPVNADALHDHQFRLKALHPLCHLTPVALERAELLSMHLHFAVLFNNGARSNLPDARPNQRRACGSASTPFAFLFSSCCPTVLEAVLPHRNNLPAMTPVALLTCALSAFAGMQFGVRVGEAGPVRYQGAVHARQIFSRPQRAASGPECLSSSGVPLGDMPVRRLLTCCSDTLAYSHPLSL